MDQIHYPLSYEHDHAAQLCGESEHLYLVDAKETIIASVNHDVHGAEELASKMVRLLNLNERLTSAPKWLYQVQGAHAIITDPDGYSVFDVLTTQNTAAHEELEYNVAMMVEARNKYGDAIGLIALQTETIKALSSALRDLVHHANGTIELTEARGEEIARLANQS